MYYRSSLAPFTLLLQVVGYSQKDSAAPHPQQREQRAAIEPRRLKQQQQPEAIASTSLHYLQLLVVVVATPKDLHKYLYSAYITESLKATNNMVRKDQTQNNPTNTLNNSDRQSSHKCR